MENMPFFSRFELKSEHLHAFKKEELTFLYLVAFLYFVLALSPSAALPLNPTAPSSKPYDDNETRSHSIGLYSWNNGNRK